MSAERILVIDDEPDIRELVSDILSDEGYQVVVAADAEEARQQLAQEAPDLILLDIWMPNEDGISLLKDWKESKALRCPVVIMSGHGTIETAVEATRLGAFGFIEKPLTTAKLISTLRKALEAHEASPGQEVTQDKELVASQLIGNSAAMQALMKECAALSKVNSWLIISGEEGTGRTTVARHIHANSGMANEPFRLIAPSQLESSELFSTLWGQYKTDDIAFGKASEFSRGTLFLQNIDYVSEDMEQHVLNFLKALRSNSSKHGFRVMVSVSSSVREKFYSALYALFSMMKVEVPSLQSHAEDIPDLLSHYVDFFCAQDHFPYHRFSIAAQNRLLHYEWPGNVLELTHLVQYLLLHAENEEISVAEVDAALAAGTLKQQEQFRALNHLFELPLREAREAFEKKYLLHQLKMAGGSVSKLAERVGMERTHLYRKLRSLGIGSKVA